MKPSDSAEKVIKDIKRATRRRFSPEDKIRIVLECLRGEDSIAAICRRESIHPNQYYKWSKDFLEAGKKRLQGDTVREVTFPPKIGQFEMLVKVIMTFPKFSTRHIPAQINPKILLNKR